MDNKKVLPQKRKSRAVAGTQETQRENEVAAVAVPPEENKPQKVETKRNLPQQKKAKVIVAIEEPNRENEVSIVVPPENIEEKVISKSVAKRNFSQNKKSKAVFVTVDEPKHEDDGVLQKVNTVFLQKKKSTAALKEETRENEVKANEGPPEESKGHDTVVFQTETTKGVGTGQGRPKFRIKGTKTKALVATQETTSFLKDNEDPSKETKSLPLQLEQKTNIKTDNNDAALKRDTKFQSALRKPNSLPDVLMEQSSSRKSVKIVLEESVNEAQNPIQQEVPQENEIKPKSKSKRSVIQQTPKKKLKTNEDGSTRPKVATVRLNSKRVSIGQRDANAEDPLQGEFIRRTSTYKEWSKQAKGVLPSNAGLEIEDGGVGYASDLLNMQDATKALKLNPNEAIKSIRKEIITHRRSSIVAEGLRRRISSNIRRGTYFDLLRPLASGSVMPVDEENPEEDASGEGVHDQRQLLLQTAVAEVSAADKIAQLRNIAAPLSRKRSFKKLIMEEAQMKGTVAGRRTIRNETIKSIFQFYWQKIKSFFHDLNHTIEELVWWKNDLKMIESTYGAETFVYFRWIRTIIFLNMMYMILGVFLLALPELFLNGHGDFQRAMSELRVSDLFTGEGSFTHRFSKFYYNGYAPTPHQRYFSSTPFRFCLCLVLIFIVNSIYIGYQVSYFYHSTRLESEIPGASLPNSIMELVCAWDHSISNITAAKLRHQVIARDFRVMLAESKKQEAEEDATNGNRQQKKNLEEMILERFGDHLGRWVIFWCINAFSLIMTVGNSGILFVLHDWRYYKTVESKLIAQGTLKVGESLEDKDIDPNFFVFLLPSVYTLISAQMYILYQLYFLKFEAWRTLENKLFALLSRVGLFWTCEISVIYIAREVHLKNMIENKICWEVTFGSEFYRLVVLQEVINFIFTLILDGYPARRHSRDEHYPLPVFDVNRHTLNIIYIHTISGVAFVYCPMLSFVVVVRLIITYYHERNVLQNWTRCNEKETNFRMSQIYVPYLTAVFISYIVSSSLNVFLIVTMDASGYCGPFNSIHYTESLKEAFGEISLFFIEVIGNPGVNVSLISLLIAALFMMKAWGHAYHCKMILLHEFLDLEKKDRDFLMRAIYNIGRASGQAIDTETILLPDEESSETSSNARWTNALQTLVHDSHSTKRTEPTTKKSKKKSTVGTKTKKKLDTGENLSLKSRRRSQAEALYLASADLALPHHALHAHKAIDDIMDLKLGQGQQHQSHAQHFASMYNIRLQGQENDRFGHHPGLYRPSVFDDGLRLPSHTSRPSTFQVQKAPKKGKKKTAVKPKTAE